MRRDYKVLISLAVSCVLLLQAGCQEQATVTEEPAPGTSLLPGKTTVAATEPSKPAPKITFESAEYDFGKVGPSQKLPGQFKFTNTGDAPLKITKVEKCCGAVTKLDKDELAPGESGVLKVEYRSSSRPSTMRKRLYVNSNDETSPRTTLTIKAEVEMKVAWEPKRLKLSLKEENAGCPEITLTSTDNQPFSITKFQSTSDCITADIDSSVQATKFVLRPTADIEKLRKRSRGYISIGLAHPESGTVSIPFQAPSVFAIKPPLLVVFYSTPTEPIKRKVRLLNNYGEDFEVESTLSKKGYIKVLSQKKIANGYEFELEITPPPLDETKKFTDVFSINLEGGEKRAVACRGIYSNRKPKTTTKK